MKRVFIAGASGSFGRYLCAQYQARGWYVIALVPKADKAAPIAADQLVEAQATDPNSLKGAMAGVELVVSCQGISGKADGWNDGEIGYQAALNLLREAERAGVARFVQADLLNALSKASVLRALDLDAAEECQGIGHPKNDFENRIVEATAANIHTLIPERKNS